MRKIVNHSPILLFVKMITNYKQILPVILKHEKWQLINSIFPDMQAPVEDQDYIAWAQKNHDYHAQKEILFSLSGKTFHTLNGKCYECRPGSVFMFDSFEQHDRGYRNEDNHLLHLWFIFFKNKTFADIHSISRGKANCRRFVAGLPETELVLETWENLKAKPGVLSYEFMRYRLVYAISNLVLKIIEISLSPPKTPQDEQPQKIIIETIKEHINETCGKNESLDNLARIAGYSKFHFLRLFKEYTGQTVHEYINNCRIRKAKEMQRKFHTKKEIAYMLGFASPSSFSNWYKKHM